MELHGLAAIALTFALAACGPDASTIGNSAATQKAEGGRKLPILRKYASDEARANFLTPAPQSPYATKTFSEEVWDAFEAATGHRSSFGVIEKGYVVATRPAELIETKFGPVLLTEVEIQQGCHACAGAIGIYYLEERGGEFRVRRRWPRAIRGWTWGFRPTEWHVTKRFTSHPAIYATGGFLAQGIMTSGATITELRPTGPAKSDLIGTSYDDEGDPEAGRQGCRVEGRIANIRKDRSFDLVVSGSLRAVARYVKKGGRFRTDARIPWADPCRD